MKYLRIFEEIGENVYKKYFDKLKRFLSEKDFDLYDGEEDLHNKFMQIVNNDDFSADEKAYKLTSYLEQKWGLHGGYEEVFEFIEMLLMDEI